MPQFLIFKSLDFFKVASTFKLWHFNLTEFKVAYIASKVTYIRIRKLVFVASVKFLYLSICNVQGDF